MATNIIISKYFYGERNKTSASGRSSSWSTASRARSPTAARRTVFATAKMPRGSTRALTWLCVHQYGSFNSPVWFNVGLLPPIRRGRRLRQGNWHWDDTVTGQAKALRGNTSIRKAVGLFHPDRGDTMEDIMRLAGAEAMLFKFGSGTGTDLSAFRSSRERLSGGGRRAGP